MEIDFEFIEFLRYHKIELKLPSEEYDLPNLEVPFRSVGDTLLKNNWLLL